MRTMDLVTGKYHLIQKLTKVTDEHVIEDIETILDPDITTAQKEELDNRYPPHQVHIAKLIAWI
jgi:hypothetical protein